MLKTMEQRERRQEEMRLRREALARGTAEVSDLLNLDEAAALLRVSRRTASRILRREPGVNLIYTPGSKRPIVRAHRSVIERILRRTANP